MIDFEQIVSSLKSGDRAYFAGMDPKHYGFMKTLRLATPESFNKKGLIYYFTGDAKKIIEEKDVIMKKMEGYGYKFESTRRVNTRFVSEKVAKQHQKIEEIEMMSDEDLFKRIQDTFDSLALLSDAAANLKIRSMIVSGSPGTGKTYEVLKAMKDRARSDKTFYYQQIKGTISPVALFIELYRARDGVLILDDADEAFMDPESLQILKAATESSKERNINYRKLSMSLESEGIPQEFIFNGCVVILTNTNLEEARKQRQSHFEAIMSRAHYITAILETDREKIMRIRHIITTTSMLNQFLDSAYHQEIIDFIEEHHTRFRELSIRTVVKLAELRAAFPKKWDTLARGTLLSY